MRRFGSMLLGLTIITASAHAGDAAATKPYEYEVVLSSGATGC